MKVAKMIKIYGRVQGVYFREYLKEQAKRIGVSGWVRNRKDGTVEAFVQGEHELVRDIIEMSRIGPPNAKVERVVVTDADPNGIIASFERLESED